MTTLKSERSGCVCVADFGCMVQFYVTVAVCRTEHATKPLFKSTDLEPLRLEYVLVDLGIVFYVFSSLGRYKG